jgi:NAD(P)-dependent dehydrogenase (short-subunit alcohol dehydrogenase family)
VPVRSVLITGASTGIGRATALRLDAAGWRVYAGVRRPEDAAALRQAGSERLLPLTLDVTDSAQIDAAAAQIRSESDGAGLDGLVNNAGIAVPGPLETLPLDDLRRQVEVNLIAQVAVTQAMLPLLRPARGRLVFLSSIGGRLAFPFSGAYHASKFAIEAVGDSLRQELRPWGIAVSIVEPGSIDTPIWERGERNADAVEARADPSQQALYGQALAGFRQAVKELAARGIAPDKVARAIAHALEARRPRTRYLVGIDAKAQARLKPLIPTRVLDRIVARQLHLG